MRHSNPASGPRRGRILIVDDEPANVGLLTRILQREGYTDVLGITDSRQAPGLVEEFRPDLILLDLRMPGLDGFGVLEAIKPHLTNGNYLPVLTLTADASDQMKQAALSRGSKDFLAKPFNPIEVLLRIQNLLELRFLYLHLETAVRDRTRELEEAQIEIVERLARAAEFRDEDTARHTRRIGDVAAQLGRAIGLDETHVDLIRRAAPLHDVGKIATPDGILLKPGPLTPEEWQIMRQHAAIGSHMLAGGSSVLMQVAERIARSHHERWDGSGYPDGLAGEAIPIEARLVAVADVLDALTHERPYRAAWPLAKVLALIESNRGTHFDPRIVDALLALHPRGQSAPPSMRRRGTPKAGVAALGLFAALVGTEPKQPPHAAGRVTGYVELSDAPSKRRESVRTAGDTAPAIDESNAEMSNVVVYLESENGSPLRSAPSYSALAQINERFVPRVLPVTLGSTVSFPNLDNTFHDVFSLSGARPFDLGRFRKGTTKIVRFDKIGAVQVFCHIHSDMSAVVLVLPNAYFARPDLNGRFAIDDVPPGTYRVVGWHERIKPIVKRITIAPGQTTSLDFNIPFARP
jgi:putative two-component system response regulator